MPHLQPTTHTGGLIYNLRPTHVEAAATTHPCRGGCEAPAVSPTHVEADDVLSRVDALRATSCVTELSTRAIHVLTDDPPISTRTA